MPAGAALTGLESSLASRLAPTQLCWVPFSTQGRAHRSDRRNGYVRSALRTWWCKGVAPNALGAAKCWAALPRAAGAAPCLAAQAGPGAARAGAAGGCQRAPGWTEGSCPPAQPLLHSPTLRETKPLSFLSASQTDAAVPQSRTPALVFEHVNNTDFKVSDRCRCRRLLNPMTAWSVWESSSEALLQSRRRAPATRGVPDPL